MAGITFEMIVQRIIEKFFISRVYAIEPFFDAVGDFPFRVTKYCLPTSRKMHQVIGQIPIPDAVICAGYSQRVALLALSQCLLCAFTFNRITDRPTKHRPIHFAFDQIILRAFL